MADIRINYKVDKKEIEKAEEALKALRKETGLTEKQANKVDEKFSNLSETVEKNNKSMGGLRGHVSGINDGLDHMGPAGQQAAAGINKLTTSFKALLSNPIVATIAAVVGALTLMTKAFLDTQAGMDAVDKVSARLSATWSVLRRAINDITSGTKSATEAFTGFWKSVKDNADAAAELTDREAALARSISHHSVQIAKNNKEIQVQLLITRDMTNAREDQREALRKINKLEEENLRMQIEDGREAIEVLEETIKQKKLANPLDEDIIALNQKKVELINLETASLSRLREVQNRFNEQEARFHAEDVKRAQEKSELLKTELQRQLAFHSQYNTLTLEQVRDLTETVNNQQRDLELLFVESEEKRLAITKKYHNLNQEAWFQYHNIIKEMDAIALDAKMEVAKAEIQTSVSVFSAIASLGEQSAGLQNALLAFEKLAAIAAVVISSQQAIGRIPATILVPGPYGAPISVPNPDMPRAIAVQETLAGIAVANILATAIPEFVALNKSETPTFHTGGYVEGNSDEVHALLQTGEFVMRRDAVSKYGLPVLEALNDMEIPAQRLSNDVRVTNLGDLSLQQFTLDEDGLHRWVTKRGNRMKYLNKRNL